MRKLITAAILAVTFSASASAWQQSYDDMQEDQRQQEWRDEMDRQRTERQFDRMDRWSEEAIERGRQQRYHDELRRNAHPPPGYRRP